MTAIQTTTALPRARLPEVTSSDRLALTLFLALALHAIIVLGISFQFNSGAQDTLQDSLDITLVLQQNKTEAPEEADYLAQADQRGGGNTQEQTQVTEPDTQPSDNEQGQAQDNRAAAAPAERTPAPQVVTTERSARVAEKPHTDPEPMVQESPSFAELMARSHEIARLEAKTAADRFAYAKRPDPKYLYANTRRHKDAAYLRAWTDQVERIGTLNYPDEALRRGLTGSLILEVRLRPNGHLIGVKILEPSEHKVLDDAAIRIIKLAAPFNAVPPDVLGERNELRIVRTWMFSVENRLLGK